MFVTFEGPEGAGKSTVILAVAERLRETHQAVVTTREPGAGDFGGRIRSILLESDAMSPMAELFLFLADRAEHVSSLIRPALQRGKIVLCDRHADSTVVYQGYGRGLDVSELRDLNRIATGGLIPDLTLLLDLPPSVGLARQSKRDRLDAEPLEFHERVRAGFLTEANREPVRWRVIDASQPLPQVIEETLEAIQARVKP